MNEWTISEAKWNATHDKIQRHIYLYTDTHKWKMKPGSKEHKRMKSWLLTTAAMMMMMMMVVHAGGGNTTIICFTCNILFEYFTFCMTKKNIEHMIKTHSLTYKQIQIQGPAYIITMFQFENLVWVVLLLRMRFFYWKMIRGSVAHYAIRSISIHAFKWIFVYTLSPVVVVDSSFKGKFYILFHLATSFSYTSMWNILL